MSSTVIRPTGFFNDTTAFSEMARRGRVWLIGDDQTHINPFHGADLAQVIAAALSSADTTDRSVGGPDVLTQSEIATAAFDAIGRPIQATGVRSRVVDGPPPGRPLPAARLSVVGGPASLRSSPGLRSRSQPCVSSVGLLGRTAESVADEIQAQGKLEDATRQREYHGERSVRQQLQKCSDGECGVADDPPSCEGSGNPSPTSQRLTERDAARSERDHAEQVPVVVGVGDVGELGQDDPASEQDCFGHSRHHIAHADAAVGGPNQPEADQPREGDGDRIDDDQGDADRSISRSAADAVEEEGGQDDPAEGPPLPRPSV